MSTDRVEVKPDATENPSLEEELKQQEAETQPTEEPKEEVQAEPAEETRPDWLPEKFKTAEDLAKAYSELEKKQSAPEKNEEAPVEQPQTNTLEPYYEEYSNNGSISEKSYAELAKLGLSKDLVDGYIEGQKAIADADVQAVHQTVGGEENYNNLLKWSEQNLSDAEQQAFNTTMETGSIEQVKMAVQAIASRAGISAEAKPQMIDGDTDAVRPEIFESTAQVIEAMNDPRYQNDPAYRKKVEQKIARSNVL